MKLFVSSFRRKPESRIMPAFAGIRDLDPVFQRGDGLVSYPQRPLQKLLIVSGTGNIVPTLR